MSERQDNCPRCGTKLHRIVKHDQEHRWQFEWRPRDLWIGAYWKRIGNCIDLWVCLLPCLPLHISWWWSEEP
jgi:hypothetical protein